MNNITQSNTVGETKKDYKIKPLDYITVLALMVLLGMSVGFGFVIGVKVMV